MPTKRTKRKIPNRSRRRMILAAGKDLPSQIFIAEPAQLDITAAEAPAEGERPKVRSFSMIAYTGGAMRLAGYYWPVVVDLAGIQVSSQSRPILFGHQIDRIVGHTESIEVSAQRIKVSGKLSGVGDDVNLVAATADNGFPWQSSIGAEAQQVEYVDRGNKVKVNGRNFDGPVYIARKTSLREISFVALGADDNTSASLAANTHPQKEPTIMGFSAWLKANGWDESSLTENQLTMLRASYEDSLEGDDKHGTGTNPGKLNAGFDADEFNRQSREAAAREAERVSAIRSIVAGSSVTKIKIGDGDQAQEVNLEAHAIREGWSANDVELRVLRASRPTGPAIHVASGMPTDALTIEAALCMTAGLPSVEKRFKPETLEASDKLRGLGLQQVLMMAAANNGYSCRPGERITAGNLRTILRHAFADIVAATSLSVPGILSNVANKEILEGYEEVDNKWREISNIKPVSDFKTVTSYRLLDNMEYEELAPDGQIKHGSVGEESFSRQAKTYAKMFSLTRTDIINDDMGAFDDLRTRLGRGAAKKLSNIFWAKFINNSTFFTSGRTNYIEGATTNLGLDGVGLGLGVLACSKMTSPAADGRKRVGAAVEPTILLHPPELKTIADTLYTATNISAVKTSDANVHANKYRPVSVPQLSESTFTGYSATAWYLFGAWLKPMTVSFLNGNQTPIVETADADFNTLGVQMRGYHDFGCDQAEYLSGVKSKGAA